MKKPIDVFAAAETILKALPKGILLTTQEGTKTNTMIIGWGSLGVNWGKPVFTAYVRESRYTWPLLERTREFTINVPTGALDPKVLQIAGSKSGRDLDKIKELGLTTVPGEKVSVPAIKELPLTLECKVIYIQKQDLDQLTDEASKARFYPTVPPALPSGDTQDTHFTIMGEIVAAYLEE